MKFFTPKYYIFLLLTVFTISSVSEAVQEKFVFRQIKIEDGLSQSSIFSMLQDSKGYLWFGTANGLNRYDGYNFKIFINDPLDSNTISDNGILSILEDKDGYIWVGTVEGVLNRYDRKSGKFRRYYYVHSLPAENKIEEDYFNFPLPYSRNSDNSITSIVQTKDGMLWIGTWGKGLIKFDPSNNRFNQISGTGNRSFNAKRIKALIADGTDLWVGTIGDGIYKLSPGKDRAEYQNFRNKPGYRNSLSDDKIISMYKDRKGNLWVGTFGGGLNLLPAQNGGGFRRFMKSGTGGTAINHNIVTSIVEDRSGFLWIGTYGGGLDRYDPATGKIINFVNDPLDPASISKNDILVLMEDRSGTMWIGAHLGKGLNKVETTTEKFKQINKDLKKGNGLNDDVVWAIVEDENSVVWIGTYKGGLNVWDRKRSKFSFIMNDPARANSLGDNHIRALKDDGKGNLWIGTYSGGLNIFNKSTRTFKRFVNNKFDSLSIGANQVQSIFFDSRGKVWIGTFGGGLNLVKFLKERVAFKRYSNNPYNPFSLSDDRVYTIFEDSDGIFWIGTFGGGLNKFDPSNEQFISYKNIAGDESSLSDNRVMTIYEDSRKNLWIGTYGGGFLLFDRKKEKFTRYLGKERLNSSVVYGILEDGRGYLWLSTDNGIFKFNTRTEQFVKYDLSDGLQSVEFSGGAYFKSPKGEMFFGGINGLNYFYPDSVKDNNYIPPIVVSSINIFNEPIAGESDTLILPYNRNFVSFEFAALDYTNPFDNQYAYILEGLEDEWHYVDSRHRISNYSNLSPGTYYFRVRGSNNDGLWNNVGIVICLIIEPPFWQTWWFVSISVLLIAFLIYYASTVRYRNLLAIERIKSKLSADLHDNIGSGLTEISILSELAANDIASGTQQLAEKLEVISEKARTLIDNMSDIVWMVNPKRDSLYHIILRLKDTYSDLLNSMGISFGTANIEKFTAVKLPMEYKQNLYLIFKEAINNSIKHSRCKKIMLEGNINKDILELTLKDDGVGLDFNSINYGNGLLNMKSRARVIGGKLEILSENSGTTIKFTGKISGLNKAFYNR